MAAFFAARCLGLDAVLGPPPSMTPPVRTVVFPPSYGVTSVLDVSTKTRACRARSRREGLMLLLSLLLEEETEVREDAVSTEVKENPDELEFEERELQRDCSEILERGEVDRAGIGN